MSNKFVVYTVITGGFDSVRQPEVIDPRFDYILFTDSVTSSKFGVWSVREIGYDCKDLRKKSRYPKIHPELSLAEYEASLYIDGNISVTSQYVYDRCVALAGEGVEWAGIKHQRDCVYDEMNAIIGLGWVHDYDVLDWYRFLRSEGFPDHEGLFENNIIFRLHSQTVGKIDDIWWWTIEKWKVKRDQFSLMYAIWKTPGVKKSFFLAENENAWHNAGHFDCGKHQPHKRVIEKSLWEKMRDRYVKMFYWHGGWEIFYTHWFDKLLKHPFPHLAMHLWTAWIAVRYDHKTLLDRGKSRLARS